MFFWPNLELTEYEKRFVSPYKTADKPGVLRRTYKVLLNSYPISDVPGLENPHLEGSVQIARRSRIFGLTFGGDVQHWRLGISTASGETFTPRFAGGLDPMVSAMTPGSMWHINATDMNGPIPIPIPTGGGSEGERKAYLYSQYILPLIIEPNWELSPNEQLIFRGSVPPLPYIPIEGEIVPTAILEIGVHVWEFPGMVMGAEGAGCPPRMGGGPSLNRSRKKQPKKDEE
jgi:hypothetical protein